MIFVHFEQNTVPVKRIGTAFFGLCEQKIIFQKQMQMLLKMSLRSCIMNKKNRNKNDETAFEMVNKYGTYEIQPTADTENLFPCIAQGNPQQNKKKNKTKKP